MAASNFCQVTAEKSIIKELKNAAPKTMQEVKKMA